MKKYAIVASLFLLNNEVVSWIALVIICVMALAAFCKAVVKEGGDR